GSLSNPLHQSLSADPPAAERARGGARRAGQSQPLLGSQGPAGAASAPRSDARQALWLHRAARWGSAPISAERYLTGRALRARDLGLSLLRSARRARTDRGSHPGATTKPLFLRTQGTGVLGSRKAGRSYRAAAACGPARAQPEIGRAHV